MIIWIIFGMCMMITVALKYWSPNFDRGWYKKKGERMVQIIPKSINNKDYLKPAKTKEQKLLETLIKKFSIKGMTGCGHAGC